MDSKIWLSRIFLLVVNKNSRLQLKSIRFLNSVLHDLQLTQFGGYFQLRLAWKSAASTIKLRHLKNTKEYFFKNECNLAEFFINL